jgi:hypothetical protein
MNRRDFITLLGGAAAAWPLAARTQQAEQYGCGVLSHPDAEPDGLHVQASGRAFRGNASQAPVPLIIS